MKKQGKKKVKMSQVAKGIDYKKLWKAMDYLHSLVEKDVLPRDAFDLTLTRYKDFAFDFFVHYMRRLADLEVSMLTKEWRSQ